MFVNDLMPALLVTEHNAPVVQCTNALLLVMLLMWELGSLEKQMLCGKFSYSLHFQKHAIELIPLLYKVAEVQSFVKNYSSNPG